MRHFILIEHEAVKVELLDWARWYERSCEHGGHERRVAYTMVTPEVEVSTVFLPIETFMSALQELDPPIIFETKVFGGPLDDMIERYCSWDDALKGHWEVVRQVQERLLCPT